MLGTFLRPYVECLLKVLLLLLKQVFCSFLKVVLEVQEGTMQLYCWHIKKQSASEC